MEFDRFDVDGAAKQKSPGSIKFVFAPDEMNANFTVQRGTADDTQEIALMVGELLVETMNATVVQAFNFDVVETTSWFMS